MNKIFTSAQNNEQINLFNPPEEMHYTVFVENKEENEKDPTLLSFWVNDKGKIFLEMKPESGDDDWIYYQCMTLGKTDILKLIEELNRLVQEYELAD